MIFASLFLVIVIASFTPHPIRGIVIMFVSLGGAAYTMYRFKPRTELPELPSTPSEEAGEDLIAKHGVDKSLNHTDPLRKMVVDTVHANKNPNIKK